MNLFVHFLKSDMKIMLKNFADTINAIVKNDVTDNTTHLIVDSSKLLKIFYN
jgi:hypothetical protein